MFTDIQKLKILRYIGWSTRPLDASSRYYTSFLDERLQPGTLVVNEAVELLNRIINIDNEIISAVKRVKVTNIDSIGINRYELNTLRSERAKVIGELMTLLDVYPPNYYGIQNG